MADPRGFLTNRERRDRPSRPVPVRIMDWKEVYEPGDSAVLRRQAGYPRIALSGPPRVIYSGDGRPDSTATPFTLSATDASAETYRCLRLRLNGRSAIDRGTC